MTAAVLGITLDDALVVLIVVVVIILIIGAVRR